MLGDQMIQIDDKKQCCGCTACESICPKKAIKMLPDEEGFLYPHVEETKCIQCGLCEKTCPIINTKKSDQEPKGYIVRNTDKEIVQDSTSGGVFTAIANYVLDKQGVVYGVGYDSSMRVIYKKAENKSEIAEMRGSKFVQSYIVGIYEDVKQTLGSGRLVLFTGTPCQVAGLINFLRKKPDNLYCVDFICRGVASPLLWENYLQAMQDKYKSAISFVKFKNKTYGYHATTMKVDFQNGKTYKASGRIDPMMKSYVNELASRPSCAACSFKSERHISDLTMFDCYHYSAITRKKDDNKGYSSLFVNSYVGEKIIESIAKSIEMTAVDYHELTKWNGIMVCNSAKPHSRRDEFYSYISTMTIHEAINKVMPITKKDYLIELSKAVINRIGLIQFLKKLKKEKIETT